MDVQTPATVFLEQAEIVYEVMPYEHDPNAESYGLEAASALNVDPGTVFKTLVARLDSPTGQMVTAIVPVTGQLSLKALARAAGAKRAQMAEVKDAERSSGYVAGGISPFGQRRQLDTYIDETAELYDRIFVSGGQRGVDLRVSPSDVISALQAVVAPLAS